MFWKLIEIDLLACMEKSNYNKLRPIASNTVFSAEAVLIRNSCRKCQQSSIRPAYFKQLSATIGGWNVGAGKSTCNWNSHQTSVPIELQLKCHPPHSLPPIAIACDENSWPSESDRFPSICNDVSEFYFYVTPKLFWGKNWKLK